MPAKVLRPPDSFSNRARLLVVCWRRLLSVLVSAARWCRSRMPASKSSKRTPARLPHPDLSSCRPVIALRQIFCCAPSCQTPALQRFHLRGKRRSRQAAGQRSCAAPEPAAAPERWPATGLPRTTAASSGISAARKLFAQLQKVRYALDRQALAFRRYRCRTRRR